MPVNPFLAASNPFLETPEARKRRLLLEAMAAGDRQAEELGIGAPAKPLTLTESLMKRGELAAKGFTGALYGGAERVGNMPRALAYPLGLGNAREALSFIEPGTKAAMDEREAELKRQLLESSVAKGGNEATAFFSSEGPGILGGAAQNLVVPLSKPMQALAKARTPLLTAARAAGLSGAEGAVQGWGESAGRSLPEQAKMIGLTGALSGLGGAAPGLGRAVADARATKTLVDALKPEPSPIAAGPFEVPGPAPRAAPGDFRLEDSKTGARVDLTLTHSAKEQILYPGIPEGPMLIGTISAPKGGGLAIGRQAMDYADQHQLPIYARAVAFGERAAANPAAAQARLEKLYGHMGFERLPDPDGTFNLFVRKPKPTPATAVKEALAGGAVDSDSLLDAALVDLPPVDRAHVKGKLKNDFEFSSRVYGDQDADAEALVNGLKANEQAALQARGVGVQVPIQKLSAEQEAFSLAATMGIPVEELLKPRRGFTLDAEGMRAVNSESRRLVAEESAIAKQFADGTKAGTMSPVDLDALKTKLAETRERNAKVMVAALGHRSDLGRSLGSLRFAVRRAAASPDEFRTMILQRYKEQLDDATIQKIAQLDPEKPEDFVAFARTMEHPSFRSMFDTAWVASILSGMGTHVKNLQGNLTQLGTDLVERPLAAGIDASVTQLGLKKTRSVRLMDQGAAWVGAAKGARIGVAKAAYVLKNGFDKDQAISKFAGDSKYGLFRNPFVVHPNAAVRGVGTALTAPLRALEAADTFFRAVSKTSKQHEMASLKASTSKQPAASHLLDDDVLAAADEFGKRMTYTDKLSGFGGWVSEGVHKAGEASLFWGRAAKTAFPFIGIPDRIIARGFEHSPLGLTRTIWRGFEDAIQKGELRPDTAEQAARGIVGTYVAFTAWGLYADGRLTGPPPRDKNERAEFYRTKRAFSYLPAGGRADHPEDWIPYSQLGPLGTTLGAAATAASIHKTGQEDGASVNLAASAIQGTAKFVLEQGYMTALQDILEGIQDEKRGGELLAKHVASVAGGVVPYSAAQRGVAQAMDPTVRNVSSERDGWQGGVETVQNTIMANTPGLSDNLPAKITPYGEDVVRQETPLAPFIGRDTPGIKLADRPRPEDPVADAMASVGEPMRFGMPRLKQTQGGRVLLDEKIPAADYQRIQKEAAQFVRTQMQQALDTGQWASYPPEQQAAFAKMLQDKALELARARWAADRPKKSGL